MFICYDTDNIVRGPSSGPSFKCDPHKQYLTHYGHMLYLSFLAKHPQSTMAERFQVEKELPIAERKLKYWANEPDFVMKQVEAGMKKLREQWS